MVGDDRMSGDFCIFFYSTILLTVSIFTFIPHQSHRWEEKKNIWNIRIDDERNKKKDQWSRVGGQWCISPRLFFFFLWMYATTVHVCLCVLLRHRRTVDGAHLPNWVRRAVLPCDTPTIWFWSSRQTEAIASAAWQSILVAMNLQKG